MTVFCIGDSNTYGYDPLSAFGSRYPEDVCWTERLKGWEIINGGMNGMTVPVDISVFTDWIRSKKPDLVTVMLGSNDLLMGESAETTAGRMEAFLAAVGETGVPVLLIAPPPMQRGDWVRSDDLVEASRKLSVLYRRLAARMGIPFADAGAWNVEMTFDGVHFSPAGHAAFAEGLSAVLRDMSFGTEQCGNGLTLSGSAPFPADSV